MGWNREKITADRLKLFLDNYNSSSGDEEFDIMETLRNRIVALETALYPFVTTLGSLGEDHDAKSHTYASSKLFPMLSDNEKFLVYKSSEKEGVGGTSEELPNTPPESKLHEINYYEEDSLSIQKGSELHDDFIILAVHQSVPCAYVGCGSISMGDVRHAASVLHNKDY